MKTYNFEEMAAKISGNSLRQFPGAQKGRNRLFPVPRPRMEKGMAIGENAAFFVVGACFARSLEKGLKAAGRTVLSSRVGLGLEGSEEDQFNRYNVSGLDVAMNEIRWALGVHSVPDDAPLLPFRGEVIDLQLHWSFAHDEETARAYRAIYNKSFASVAEADVVVLTLSNTRQWFDLQTGAYINAMPSSAMRDAYPGRFEMHEFDHEDMVAKIDAALSVIRETSKKSPKFLLGVSPVYQAMSMSPDDALTDLFHVKAVLRTAVQSVCEKHDDVTYLPCLEAGVMSDFRHSYVPNSPNHALPILAERVVADALSDLGGTDSRLEEFRARVFAATALSAGDVGAAIALCEPWVSNRTPIDDALLLTYAEALVGDNRTSDAVAALIDSLERGSCSKVQLIWNRATALLNVKNVDHVARLTRISGELDVDARLLSDRISDKSHEVSEASKKLAKANVLRKAESHTEALEVLQPLRELTSAMTVKMRENYYATLFSVVPAASGAHQLMHEAECYLASEKPLSSRVMLHLASLLRKNMGKIDGSAIDRFLLAADDACRDLMADPKIPNALEGLKARRRRLGR